MALHPPTTAYYASSTAYYAPTTAYYAPTTAYYAPTTAYYRSDDGLLRSDDDILHADNRVLCADHGLLRPDDSLLLAHDDLLLADARDHVLRSDALLCRLPRRLPAAGPVGCGRIRRAFHAWALTFDPAGRLLKELHQIGEAGILRRRIAPSEKIGGKLASGRIAAVVLQQLLQQIDPLLIAGIEPHWPADLS